MNKTSKAKKKKKLNELDRHCRWNIITLRKTFCAVMILECTDIFSGALTRNRKLMNIHVCSAQRHRKSQTPNISEHRTAHFQRRITDCSIVFQINKYVTLTCFLNICKHIMVFLCFSRVKILHTAPLTLVLFVEPCDWIKGVEAVFSTIALHSNVLLCSRYVVITLP